jgi:hypothetical protein
MGKVVEQICVNGVILKLLKIDGLLIAIKEIVKKLKSIVDSKNEEYSSFIEQCSQSVVYKNLWKQFWTKPKKTSQRKALMRTKTLSSVNQKINKKGAKWGKLKGKLAEKLPENEALKKKKEEEDSIAKGKKKAKR